MELVEGRSIAEALPPTGFPLDRLLKIAIPVVDAITAAHQKGITHRDLKPANVVLGEGEHVGRVKVLDFGLAKLTGTATSAESCTSGPTALITGEGRILGTVAYMSPEQAEGKPIDARSDLFSIGVVLYEMATGRRPFTGDTSVSIISSIIKDTPQSVTELKPSLPRELGRIVRRALMKDPDRRYQTAKDLRNDLEELKAALDSGELASESAARARPGDDTRVAMGGDWPRGDRDHGGDGLRQVESYCAASHCHFIDSHDAFDERCQRHASGHLARRQVRRVCTGGSRSRERVGASDREQQRRAHRRGDPRDGDSQSDRDARRRVRGLPSWSDTGGMRAAPCAVSRWRRSADRRPGVERAGLVAGRPAYGVPRTGCRPLGAPRRRCRH
jgi:serine/threonine protein kinase